jgi:hypothetical protein
MAATPTQDMVEDKTQTLACRFITHKHKLLHIHTYIHGHKHPEAHGERDKQGHSETWGQGRTFSSIRLAYVTLIKLINMAQLDSLVNSKLFHGMRIIAQVPMWTGAPVLLQRTKLCLEAVRHQPLQEQIPHDP